MDPATFGVERGQHVPGEVAHQYLRAYAENFGFYSKIRFNSRVDTIERKSEGSWLVTYVEEGLSASAGMIHEILTRKLIVATGVFSEPYMPTFEGTESFDAPLFHSKDLAAQEQVIRAAESVVIVAGSKSGYDAAYLAASSGVEVDWIIRPSGRGAIWITPPYVTPLKKWLEKLVNTRFLTWLSPCSWGEADGFSRIRRFFHGTAIGRWIVDRFWWILANDVLRLSGYDKHPETRKLKPWTDVFWAASEASILNYPSDFFDYVRNGQIRIHVSDISHLSSKTVHLTTGESIQTDALISATGWKGFPPIKFLPEGIDLRIGNSRQSQAETLDHRADEEILARFPRLRKQPIVNHQHTARILMSGNGENAGVAMARPFRLYRFMVPPDLIRDQSIGFAGMVTNFGSLTCAQVQALWLTAYLDGKLRLNDTSPTFYDDVQWDATLHSRFGKWRHPFGNRYVPDFIFDLVPYIDWLLGDLGLKVHRKGGRLAEWFEAYGPADYRDLVCEWKTMCKIE
jgi:cation diffusion facilitator CzcD-associated flavoprotein CzcO